MVDAYALALASLLLAGGTIGDLRGHKRSVLFGLGVFAVAPLACALAPSTGVLIAARVGHAFPERGEQARAIGIWDGVGAVALPAGPLLGGALVDGIGWRAVFFLNVPIVLAAAVVATRVVRESTGDRARRLDRPACSSPGCSFVTVTRSSKTATPAWTRRLWRR